MEEQQQRESSTTALEESSSASSSRAALLLPSEHEEEGDSLFFDGDSKGGSEGKQEPQKTSLDDYYSNTNWDKEEDEVDKNEKPRSTLEDAVPMEKIRNGASNAISFLSWGYEKVAEQAHDVHEKLQQNENYRAASERVGEVYETKVKPGFEKVYDTAKPRFEDVRERTRPSIDELSTRASEGWTITRQKIGELSEACRPGVEKAQEKTREFFEVASGSQTTTGSAAAFGEPAENKENNETSTDV